MRTLPITPNVYQAGGSSHDLFPQMGTTAVVALAFSGSALADDITGAGSTFVFPILSKWSGEYSAKTGTKLDYQPIGSGRGIVQIKASAVDFGASDATLKPEDLKNSDLGQFPRLSGAKRTFSKSHSADLFTESRPTVSLLLSTAACITTREMPLAPNAVRLDIQASSLLFTGKVASTTMRRAAELSLQKGFTQFRFEQAAMAGLGAGGRLLVGQRIGPARLLATRVCRRPLHIHGGRCHDGADAHGV